MNEFFCLIHSVLYNIHGLLHEEMRTVLNTYVLISIWVITWLQ